MGRNFRRWFSVIGVEMRCIPAGHDCVPRIGLTGPLGGARMGFVAKTQVRPLAEARDLVRCGEPNGGRACSLKTKQRKRE
jgi:hypothetical protein